MRNQKKGGGAYGSIPENCGGLQDYGTVAVLSAAGLQERHDPAIKSGGVYYINVVALMETTDTGQAEHSRS